MTARLDPGIRLLDAIARLAELTRGRPSTGIRHDEADAEVGSIATDDAVGFDPLPVLRALSDQGAPAVVIGQVAGILHGSRELTGDLDLLWSGRPENAYQMATAFSLLEAQLFDDEHRPVSEAESAFSLQKVLFHTASVSGDCCTPRLPWGPIDVAAFLGRAESTVVDGIQIRYLARDDLMSMREVSGRPKDLRRLTELKQLGGSMQ